MMERKSFLLRIDPALWAELEAWARTNCAASTVRLNTLLRQAAQKRKGGQPRQVVLKQDPPPAES